MKDITIDLALLETVHLNAVSVPMWDDYLKQHEQTLYTALTELSALRGPWTPDVGMYTVALLCHVLKAHWRTDLPSIDPRIAAQLQADCHLGERVEMMEQRFIQHNTRLYDLVWCAVNTEALLIGCEEDRIIDESRAYYSLMHEAYRKQVQLDKATRASA